MAICSHEGCDGRARGGGLCNKHYLRLRRHGSTDVVLFVRGSLEERFWFHVVKGETEDACWRWKGHLLRTGYPHLQTAGLGSPRVLAHRLSYELHHGLIPEGKIVMHSCDNRQCTNPRHLSLGTHHDNTQDMMAKGRNNTGIRPKGEANGKSRLTEDAVRFIRAHPDWTYQQLADRFGVSDSAIWGVRSGRVWSHIT